jgi:branched-chain amino acid transport system permease protein
MTDPAKPETPTPRPVAASTPGPVAASTAGVVVAPTDLPKAGAPPGHPTAPPAPPAPPVPPAPPAPPAAGAAAASGVLDRFARRHRLRAVETLPFLAAIACFFVFPDYLVLGAQILATILFALSLDLILGYAGILTLGHVAFFGTGAYVAGLLAAHGWGEPISGLFAAALGAAVIGLASGAIVLRTQGLPLLMLTLVIAEMLKEAANKASTITGGADGLQGMQVDPILDHFGFDMLGRTAYLYCLAVLFIFWWIARRIIHSSFGRSLTGIRENVERMHAIGSPVFRRRLVIYTVSAAMAGVSGALFAQTAGFVGLDTLGFDRSGIILIMLILGGVGRLYGAFIGVPLYMIAQDRFSEIDPVYWYFWIGLLLVLVVIFARGGVLGLAERLGQRGRQRVGRRT